MEQKYRFGIDLGTSSLGVAIYKIDEKGNILSLEHLDSYIFGEPVAPKEMVTLNTAKRDARLIRRQIERKAARLKKISYIAKSLGITKEDISKDKEDVIFLRAKALEQKISLVQLIKVFCHLVKNRGYKGTLSNEEKGTIGKKIKQTEDYLKNEKTLGQLLYERQQQANGQPWRKVEDDGTFIYRKQIEKEFDLIWQEQIKHHPELTTNYQVWGENMFPDFPNQKEISLKNAFSSAIFYQRPIKWEQQNVGNCELFSDEKRASCAQIPYQYYRIVKDVSNLRLYEKGSKDIYPLTLAQITQLSNHIEISFSDYEKENKTFSFKKIKEYLNLPDNIYFTGERKNGTKTGIKGNTTLFAFEKAGILHLWSELSDKIQEIVIEFLSNITDLADIEDNDNEYIKQRIIDLTENIKSNEQEKKDCADFILSLKGKNIFVNLDLENKRSSYSTKALRYLTDRILQGEEENNVIQEIVSQRQNSSDKLRSTQAIIKQEYITDPVIKRSLNELHRIMTYLISKYGKPNEMVVELSREIKNSLRRRQFLEGQNKIQSEERKKAISELQDNNVLVTPRNIEKYLLWQEQDKCCPYSGQPISFAQAFDEKQTQVDHIIPQRGAIAGPNTFENKVLAFTQENKEKSNQLPSEWKFKQDIEDYEAFNIDKKAKKKKGEQIETSFGKHSPLINFVEHLWVLYNKEKKGYYSARDHKWKPSQKGARILRKINNLLMNPAKLKADFDKRQKQEIDWIGKIILNWYKDICPKVTPSYGALTAYMRSSLNFDKILPCIRISENKPLFDKDDKEIDSKKWQELFTKHNLSYDNTEELKEDFEKYCSSKDILTEKDKQKSFFEFCREERSLIQFNKRCDHRHHAVDAAVIGLCDLSLVQRASKHNAKNGTLHKIEYIDTNGTHDKSKDIAGFTFDNIPAYEHLLEEVKTRLTNYVVWHKPDHFPSGKFFDETAYNLQEKQGVKRFVKRAPLSSFVKNTSEKTIENLEKLLFADTIKNVIINQFKGRIAKGLSPEEALCGKKGDEKDGIYYRGNKIKQVKYMFLTGKGLREFNEEADKEIITLDKSGQKHHKTYQNAGYACMDFDLKTGKRIALIPLWKYNKKQPVPQDIVRIFIGDMLFDKKNKQFYKVQQFSARDGLGLVLTTETNKKLSYTSNLKNYILVKNRQDIARLKNNEYSTFN